MNRSFRAQESQMQTSMRQRQQDGSLITSMIKEKEDELAMFLEMQKRGKEKNNFLQNSEEFDEPLGSKQGNSSIFNIASSSPAPTRRTGAEDFLNSDSDKNDYDWLLTPPGTPLFPSLEMESQRTVMGQIGTHARPTSIKSRLAYPQLETTARINIVSKQHTSTPGLNSTSAGPRKPSSSGGPGSRPATPTGRSTLTVPTSKPSRSSTPISRPTLPSTTKPSAQSRSSTPTSRSTARSSTPTSRPSVPLSKPTSRGPTPTRKATTTSSAPQGKPSSTSSSVPKSGPTPARPTPPTVSKTPVSSRGPSPTVKPRPLKPVSHDAPPNLRTLAPERPLSASRGRPGAPSPRSSSVEPSPSGRPRRQQSSSPSRGRAPNGVSHFSGSSVPAIRRSSTLNDNVSPVMMGTKMVERVVNMRKLVPPKPDDNNSPNLSGKSTSSPDSSGFGRNLSKKSLDMAIRHMDIRRSIPGNLRPLMTNIPASSMYSVRSGPARNRPISVSDSPLATSSNASSELSVNNNDLSVDTNELDNGRRRPRSPPTSIHGR